MADRSALICDLAETYGVYDMEAVPAKTLAALAAGLRENARIWGKLRGGSSAPEPSVAELLLARCADMLTAITVGLGGGTEDGSAPASMVDLLLGRNKAKEGGKKAESLQKFDTAQDFASAWRKGGGG